MRKLRIDRTGRLAAWGTAMALLAAPALAQPANNTCTTAIPVTVGSTAGTTVGATSNGSSLCAEFSPIPDVYYDFIAPADGAYQFDTVGSVSTGNVVTLYDSCPTGPFGFRIVLGCDQGSGAGGQAQLRHLMSAGEFVSIAVANTDPAGQPFTLNVSGPLPPPPNDECAGAFVVQDGVPFIGDSTGATTSMMFDEQTDCNSTRGVFAVGADDVFLSFTPAVSGFYDVSSCGSTYNTVLSVHDGCPATPANSIACFDEAPAGFCSSEYGDEDSYLPGLELQGGVTYTIRVAGFADRDYFNQDPPAIVGGQQGRYEILVASAAQQHPNPPANDLCINAEVLAPDSFVPGSNIYATGVSGPCVDPAFGDPFDVWYSFTAASAGENLYVFEVIADSTITSNEMTLAFYETCGGPHLTCLASNFFLSGVPRRQAIALSQGETILLRVAALGGYQGTFTVSVFDSGPAAPNATCDTAISVAAGSSTPVDPATAPTSLPSDCPGANFDINALWYSFTAPQTAYYQIGAGVEIDLPTVISIFDGCGSPMASCISGGFGPATTTLHMTSGQTILMRVAPESAGSTSFDLTVSDPIPPPPPPANDDCANATVLSTFPFTEMIAFAGATSDPDTTCNDPSLAASGAGVWYTITPTQTCLLEPQVFTDDPANQPLVITAFEGACGSLTEIGCLAFSFPPPGIVVEAGHTYYLLLHYRDTLNPGLVTGDVTFNCTPVPENDTCANATEVIETDAQIVIDTAAATADGESACTGFDQTAHKSVWYTFTTGAAGDLNVHDDLTMGFIDGSFMALFTGECGALTEVTCADNPGSFFPAAQYDLTAALTADTTYLLLVASRGFPASLVHSLTFTYNGTFTGGCAADLDGNETVDVFDLLAYLDLWFPADPAADIDGTPGVDVFDLLAYLDLWFPGC